MLRFAARSRSYGFGVNQPLVKLVPCSELRSPIRTTSVNRAGISGGSNNGGMGTSKQTPAAAPNDSLSTVFLRSLKQTHTGGLDQALQALANAYASTLHPSPALAQNDGGNDGTAGISPSPPSSSSSAASRFPPSSSPSPPPPSPPSLSLVSSLLQRLVQEAERSNRANRRPWVEPLRVSQGVCVEPGIGIGSSSSGGGGGGIGSGGGGIDGISTSTSAASALPLPYATRYWQNQHKVAHKVAEYPPSNGEAGGVVVGRPPQPPHLSSSRLPPKSLSGAPIVGWEGGAAVWTLRTILHWPSSSPSSSSSSTAVRKSAGVAAAAAGKDAAATRLGGTGVVASAGAAASVAAAGGVGPALSASPPPFPPPLHIPSSSPPSRRLLVHKGSRKQHKEFLQSAYLQAMRAINGGRGHDSRPAAAACAMAVRSSDTTSSGRGGSVSGGGGGGRNGVQSTSRNSRESSSGHVYRDPRTEVGAVLELIKLMRASGVPLNHAQTLNTALSVCKRSGDFAAAEHIVFEAVELDGCIPDRRSLNLVIGTATRCEDGESALGWLRTWTSVALRCEERTTSEKATRSSSDGERDAGSSDVSSVLAGLASNFATHHKHQQQQQQRELLDRRRAKVASRACSSTYKLGYNRHAFPDIVSFNSTLAALAKSGCGGSDSSGSGSSESGSGSSPSSSSWEASMGVLEAMEQLVNRRAEKASPWEIVHLDDPFNDFEALCQATAVPPLFSFLSVPLTSTSTTASTSTSTSTSESCGATTTTDTTTTDTTFCVTPDVVSLGTAMDACSRAGRCEEALTLLHDMQSPDGRFGYLNPSASCFNTCLAACVRAQQTDAALELFWDMFISSASDEDRMSKAASVFEEDNDGAEEVDDAAEEVDEDQDMGEGGSRDEGVPKKRKMRRNMSRSRRGRGFLHRGGCGGGVGVKGIIDGVTVGSHEEWSVLTQKQLQQQQTNQQTMQRDCMASGLALAPAPDLVSFQTVLLACASAQQQQLEKQQQKIQLQEEHLQKDQEQQQLKPSQPDKPRQSNIFTAFIEEEKKRNRESWHASYADDDHDEDDEEKDVDDESAFCWWEDALDILAVMRVGGEASPSPSNQHTMYPGGAAANKHNQHHHYQRNEMKKKSSEPAAPAGGVDIAESVTMMAVSSSLALSSLGSLSSQALSSSSSSLESSSPLLYGDVYFRVFDELDKFRNCHDNDGEDDGQSLNDGVEEEEGDGAFVFESGLGTLGNGNEAGIDDKGNQHETPILLVSPVSPIAHNAVLRALASGGQWRLALLLLDGMCLHGDPCPDRNSFNTAPFLLRSCLQSRVVFNTNKVLGCLESCGQHEAATRLYRAACAAGVYAHWCFETPLEPLRQQQQQRSQRRWSKEYRPSRPSLSGNDDDVDGTNKGNWCLDLHGCSVSVAAVVVRTALTEQRAAILAAASLSSSAAANSAVPAAGLSSRPKPAIKVPDLIVVTGRGLHSQLKQREGGGSITSGSVVKTESVASSVRKLVTEMLMMPGVQRPSKVGASSTTPRDSNFGERDRRRRSSSSFEVVSTVPGNAGRLLIPGGIIEAWSFLPPPPNSSPHR